MVNLGLSWSFSSHEQVILTALNVSGSALSFLGSLFIMTTYLWNQSLQKLAFQLLFYVSIADIIRSFGNLWGNLSDGNACKAQGFLSEFGGVASFFWIGFISVIMYGIVFEKGRWDTVTVEKLKRRAHWMIWPFALILAILPLTTDSYEDTGGWCFIGHESISQVWAFLCFYGWLWLVMLGTVILYCRLYSKLTDLQLNKLQLKSSHVSDEPDATLNSSQLNDLRAPITDNYDIDEQRKMRKRMLHMVRRMFFYPS
ncbi:hypothetical protein RFI_28304, partial [Reticulomyxa filosa]